MALCLEINFFSVIMALVSLAKVSTRVLKLPPSASSTSSSVDMLHLSFEITMCDADKSLWSVFLSISIIHSDAVA